jgi:predicted enzyme related to lactoylglutathione lyase
MSHRSRLCAAYVDVPRESFPDAVRFYAELTGRAAQTDDDPDYASFGESGPGVELVVQAVGEAAPRVHLDIESDDIDAEVDRLVGLGATVLSRIGGWVVMADPVGNPFCVIKVQQQETFDAHAATWS